LFSLVFICSFLGAVAGSWMSLFWFKKEYREDPDLPIIESGSPKVAKKARNGKLKPRALTEEMAYYREKQEEGENRG
jgi:hypothetical protein